MSVVPESRPLAALVDLERYPLCNDAAFEPITERCRVQLQESSFACLPGFLRSDVAQLMTTEVLKALRAPTAANRPLVPTMNPRWTSMPLITCGGANMKVGNSLSQPMC